MAKKTLNIPLLKLKELKVRALFIGDKIDTRALEKTNVLASSPLLLNCGEKSIAALFKYGSVVFFNAAPVEEATFIDYIKPLLSGAVDNFEMEEINIFVTPNSSEKIEGNSIYLPKLSLQHLQIIAEILAKSVILNNYESRVAANFEYIEPLAARLKERGQRSVKVHDLIKHIGDVLIHLHNMVGRVEVNEKPEVLWEYPQLERIYSRLEDEFEIGERQLALERKLELINRTAETALDILQTKRGLRLEWYIIILIFFEIILTLYEMFIK